MLVNLRDICAIAEQNNMAIGAFNVPSLEACRAAIDAAEETGYPVIIMHAECHDEYVPLDAIGPVMVALAERSSAMVCVHLDHCEHLSYMRRALEMGFSGAMYDGSALPYEENVANSVRAAAMCSMYDCGLECEIGSLGTRGGEIEDGGASTSKGGLGAIYTDPDQAKDFIDATGLDALACSFGTVHGLYSGEPHLSFQVLTEIRRRANVPLVMHGGSGVSDEDFLKAIDAGIRKVNYYTYGAKHAGEAVCELVDARRAASADAPVYWHDMTATAYATLRDEFAGVIRTFANGAEPLA